MYGAVCFEDVFIIFELGHFWKQNGVFFFFSILDELKKFSKYFFPVDLSERVSLNHFAILSSNLSLVVFAPFADIMD